MKLNEHIRLLICGWFFGAILKIVPKDTEEGIIILKAIVYWGKESKTYLEEKGGVGLGGK